MMLPRSLIESCVFALALLSMVGGASAGVIRDDRSDTLYTDLAATSPYAATGFFQTVNGSAISGSGTLIGNRWVLSAAHVSLGNRQFVLNGVEYGIEQIIRDPSWTGAGTGIPNGHDLMLVKLDAPVLGVTPATLTDGGLAPNDVLDEIATFTGYGTTGNGLTGAPSSAGTNEGTARAGQNVLDRAGLTINTQNGPVTYASNVLFADFDHPNDANEPETYNIFGSPTALNLEYLVALFDSGGGLFVNDNGNDVLIGVHSAVFSRNVDGIADNSFEYGDISASTMVTAADLVWINDTIVVPTIAGDFDGDGEVGQTDLDLVLHFWGASVADGEAPDVGWTNTLGVTGGLVGQDELALVLQNWGNTTALLAELDAIALLTGLTESELQAIVPEPGTLALLAFGAGGLLARRRQNG